MVKLDIAHDEQCFIFSKMFSNSFQSLNCHFERLFLIFIKTILKSSAADVRYIGKDIRNYNIIIKQPGRDNLQSEIFKLTRTTIILFSCLSVFGHYHYPIRSQIRIFIGCNNPNVGYPVTRYIYTNRVWGSGFLITSVIGLV